MKYKIVGALNLLVGFSGIIVPINYAFFVLPGLTSVYSAFEASTQANITITYIAMGILLLIGLGNIFLGINLFTARKEKYFNFAAIFLISSWVIFALINGVIVYLVIMPIYNLVSQF